MKSETKIVQLPRVLILHINRFEIDRHMLCSKVSVPVKFAQSLDLGWSRPALSSGPLAIYHLHTSILNVVFVLRFVPCTDFN